MFPSRQKLLLAAIFFLPSMLPAAQMEVVEPPAPSLHDNPLEDPITRPVAVLSPDHSSSDSALPIVIYLPGWGGSSQETIADRGASYLGRVVDSLAAAGNPVRIAVVDGRSRFRGTQYLNSSATGRYADYVTDDVFAFLFKRYHSTPEHPASCIIAGHSSGGYGALMLAMAQHDQFFAVVGLSPDSDFEVTHRPLATNEAVQALSAPEVAATMAPKQEFRLPHNGLAGLIVGLCANYAPDPEHPGRYLWLYGADGKWQPAVWQRWLEADPLTHVRQQKDAFAPGQRIYLDGAEHDDFGANIGARKMYEVLKSRPAPVTFHEPPGHHSDHLPERLQRGLTWVLHPTAEAASP